MHYFMCVAIQLTESTANPIREVSENYLRVKKECLTCVCEILSQRTKHLKSHVSIISTRWRLTHYVLVTKAG